MNESEKRNAIEFAKPLIEDRATKGQVKSALVEKYGIKPEAAGRIMQAAVRELYDNGSKDPWYWLSQDCGASTPLQRRFARRKYRELDATEVVAAIRHCA